MVFNHKLYIKLCYISITTFIIIGVSMMTTNSAHSTPLHEAVRNHDVKQVMALVKTEALEDRDGQGNTALMLATQQNHAKIAKILIYAGADVNAKNNIQDTPYLLAGAQGYSDILKLTLEYGANIKDTNRFGGNTIIPAAEKGHPETVKILLKAGVDPNHINKLGWTALLETIILGNGSPLYTEIAEILIQGGADINIPDGEGVSALHHARQKGYQDMVDLLIKSGAKE